MILIIRQKTDDKDLSKELKKRNISFFHQSVLEFNFNKRKIINQKNTFFIVASIQAVKSMKLYKQDYLDVIKKGKFLVVGEKVKEALIELGVQQIKNTFNSTHSLFKFIKVNNFKDYHFKYLCGSVTNDEFVNRMKKYKFKLTKKVVYDTTAKHELSKKTHDLIKKNRIKSIVIYSVFASKIFFKLLRQNSLENYLNDKVIFLCFSKRIADQFKGQKFKKGLKIRWSRSPNNKSLIKALLNY